MVKGEKTVEIDGRGNAPVDEAMILTKFESNS